MNGSNFVQSLESRTLFSGTPVADFMPPPATGETGSIVQFVGRFRGQSPALDASGLGNSASGEWEMIRSERLHATGSSPTA